MSGPPTGWRKSSRCGASNTCVEVAPTAGAVLVRDSADPGGPVLALTPAVFAALLADLKEDR